MNDGKDEAGRGGALLTLEPLIEAVREGVTRAGWTLSGIQKTTSYEFEGRWAGDSTRSAYLFFHRVGGPDGASVDAYLDETSRGLAANLALVLDGRPLAELGPVKVALRALGGLSVEHVPSGYSAPVTLRLRLARGGEDPGRATSEIRFKLHVPRSALDAGSAPVAAVAAAAVRAFESLLGDARLLPLVGDDADGPED